VQLATHASHSRVSIVVVCHLELREVDGHVTEAEAAVEDEDPEDDAADASTDASAAELAADQGRRGPSEGAAPSAGSGRHPSVPHARFSSSSACLSASSVPSSSCTKHAGEGAGLSCLTHAQAVAEMDVRRLCSSMVSAGVRLLPSSYASFRAFVLSACRRSAAHTFSR
jgi:hypothetical protein